MQGETDRMIDILVVDDDRTIADILKDLISGKDRSIDVCSDGLSAIEHIQKKGYDLIITDLVMPKMGGMDVLRYARNVNPEVIVIIITGYASLETAITAIKEGAYDYITKPCKLEQIRIVVENALDKIKLNRENRELLKKLQDAYNELIDLKREKGKEGKIASINFFSSNMPSLHYLYNRHTSPDNCLNELQALSSLRDKGSLTDSEFNAFKGYLIKKIGLNESEIRMIDEREPSDTCG